MKPARAKLFSAKKIVPEYDFPALFINILLGIYVRIWFGSELLQQHLLKAFVDAPIPAHIVNHFGRQNHDSFFSCSDSAGGWWGISA
jgi:hypothetical protein|tara:strand:+ start:242 stop:502 length:261 start_codon:yes stop_codon:yes gene_type:complete